MDQTTIFILKEQNRYEPIRVNFLDMLVAVTIMFTIVAYLMNFFV